MPVARGRVMRSESLSNEECIRCLAEGHYGRVALTMEALPVIQPVTYALSGDGVLFRVGERVQSH